MKAGDTVAQRYELVHEVGRGSSGTVFKATDTLLNSTVCIKFLREGLAHDENILERFKRELLLARRLSHPGICKAFDLQKLANGDVFLVMEFVEGESLAARLQREKKPLPLDEALAVVKGACEAVGAAHKESVIHRDLKPGNILLREDGQVVVVDFGIATAADLSGLTTPGLVLGSSRYIAPERWVGDTAGTASDVWSLGVILYGCLTARLPFDGEGPFGAFESMQKGPPDPPHVFNKDVPRTVEKVLAKALAYEVKDRYPDATAMAAALDHLIDPVTKTQASSASLKGSAEDSTAANLPDPKTTADADAIPTLTGAMAKAFEMPSGPASAEDDVVDISREAAPVAPDAPGAEPSPAPLDKTRVEDMSAVLEDLTAAADPTTDRNLAVPEPADTAPGADSTMLLQSAEPRARRPAWALPALIGGVALVGLALLLWAGGGSDRPEPTGPVAQQDPPAAPAPPADPAGEDHPPDAPPVEAAATKAPAAGDTEPAGPDGDASEDSNWAFEDADLDEDDEDDDGDKNKPPDPDQAETPDEPGARVSTKSKTRRRTKKASRRKSSSSASSAAQAERAYKTAERAVTTGIKKKGLRRGDVPKLDELVSSMRRAAKKGDHKRAEDLAQSAEKLLRGVSVDRSFLNKKIARFNRAYDTVQDESKRKEVGQAVAAVSGPFRRGDYDAANRALNRAFDLLR